MTVIDTLITDRTQADVDRVEELSGKGLEGMTPAELAEYLGGMKGAYNGADLNRVNEAMEYLAQRFRGYGYTGLVLRPVPVWTMTDIPSSAQMEDYLANVSTLRSILAVLPTTPAVPPDIEGLTWQEANDIEQILTDIERIMGLVVASYLRCGAMGVYSNALGLPTEVDMYVMTWEKLDELQWSWDDWNTKTWNELVYGGERKPL